MHTRHWDTMLDWRVRFWRLYFEGGNIARAWRVQIGPLYISRWR